VVISEFELDAVLAHCRALLDVAGQVEVAGSARSVTVEAALVAWQGPFGRDFRVRAEREADDLRVVVDGLRGEADEWARVWADTVNAINEQRHQARVEEISAARGFGERTFDRLVGDDSEDMVRDLEWVSVPTADTRYAATGGLERF
jgi:hypothetical protein